MKNNKNILIFACSVLLAVVFGCGLSSLLKPKNFVTIDLLKINSDYMGKALNLVTQVNANVQLSDAQRMQKAQNILKVVGGSVEQLANDYALNNNVIVIQKQVAMSGNIPDITAQIESNIDEKLARDDLINAAR
jgi:hypothetical protein